jgi:ribosomal protein L11 methyltransferase
MPWLQLIVETPRANINNIENCLIKAGAVSVTFQEYVPHGMQEKPILEPALGKTPLWDSSRLTGLFDANCDTDRINDLLAQQKSPPPEFRWEQLEDKDWEREWMDNYHPIQCATNLWICPSWKTPPDPKATNLLLDPGLAFGTGTHPTTFLCLQWLASQNFEGKNIIDYGCGSGILGIAALLLGAKKVAGIDIDPQALTATQENVIRNNLDKTQFPVYLPNAFKRLPNISTAKLENTNQADIVIANILAGPLVELTQILVTHVRVGGLICLSGILADQAETVKQAYSDYIKFEVTAEKGGWARLAGLRYQ